MQIPSAYTQPEDRLDYALKHYWDAYLNGSGATDSALVLGVRRGETEQALANYIGILQLAPLEDAQKSVAKLFDGVAAVQARDSAGFFYSQFGEMVSAYLYDPNSPLRDEDLYLPYVQRLAESSLTKPEMRAAYRYEAEMCAINPRGSTAPDFGARRVDGSIFRLHSIKAPFTLLFFSNPGCRSCKEIIGSINARLGADVASGRLAVVNIYIDEDLAEWRKYAGEYPSEWYNGYDYGRAVREGLLYNVRAIPSLYLLDEEKRILAKDAPFERILTLLER